ncbi:MAG: SRPBCC family protein [Bacteroidota bacterium]|nr:SRPBCC family protein [Bacteroidota bacterium]
MKYQQQIIVRIPRKEFIDKFSDPENFPLWQRGFLSFNQISGELGSEGSTNLLKYRMNNRKIEMTETVLRNELPEAFSATYEAKGVYNIQHNYFREINGNTEWTSESEFQFSGMMKIIGALMPGAFKKQSSQFMKDFKAFAEDGTRVLKEG